MRFGWCCNVYAFRGRASLRNRPRFTTSPRLLLTSVLPTYVKGTTNTSRTPTHYLRIKIESTCLKYPQHDFLRLRIPTHTIRSRLQEVFRELLCNVRCTQCAFTIRNLFYQKCNPNNGVENSKGVRRFVVQHPPAGPAAISSLNASSSHHHRNPCTAQRPVGESSKPSTSAGKDLSVWTECS